MTEPTPASEPSPRQRQPAPSPCEPQKPPAASARPAPGEPVTPPRWRTPTDPPPV